MQACAFLLCSLLLLHRCLFYILLTAQVVCNSEGYEFLSAIQKAMNMEFSNPAERRYVTQISASPHPISLSLSQTNHYSFSFLGFQIAILNSPTQFLFLTLSFPLVISLSIVWRVCVFMVVWLWVLVLLFLWICGHVCM